MLAIQEPFFERFTVAIVYNVLHETFVTKLIIFGDIRMLDGY